VVVLKAIVVLAGLVGLVVVVRRWIRGPSETIPPPSMGPHAMFDGGQRYVTSDERMRIETDGPSGAGEGVLMALVDALRAKGLETNPIEPESYGFMTVVEIDGEDVVLELGAGGDQEWILFVKAPSGKVAPQIIDALHSLADVRNINWR
jgi:hypothetical protein